MKTQIIAIAAVTVALSTGVLFASAGSEASARMYQAEFIELEYGPTVVQGMAEVPVRNALGRPHIQVTPEIWVYTCNFAPKHEQANEDGCTELVIVFNQGRVSEIYFANEKARTVLQSRAQNTVTGNAAILATVPMQTKGLIAQN